ncbi:hypothetical protein [Methanocella conradii]|uniref:hypothetical protein n=1 Tax=Methanocella conradii TaxID=1175444 RepID=UPI00157E00B7|nr:hypothetical protein [Methanocella conradii]
MEQPFHENKKLVADTLMMKHPKNLKQFLDSLDKAIRRNVELVRVLPLYGRYYEHQTIDDAISFIREYVEDSTSCHVIRYEVDVRYNNGDSVHGQFNGKENAIQFLNKYRALSFRHDDVEKVM